MIKSRMRMKIRSMNYWRRWGRLSPPAPKRQNQVAPLSQQKKCECSNVVPIKALPSMSFMVVRQSSFMVMKMAVSTSQWMVLVQLVATHWIKTATSMVAYPSTFIKASIAIVVWSNSRPLHFIPVRFKSEYFIGMMGQAAIAISLAIMVALPLHIKSSHRALIPHRDIWQICETMQRIRSVPVTTESQSPSASPKTTSRTT